MTKNPLLFNIVCISILTLAAINMAFLMPGIWYIWVIGYAVLIMTLIGINIAVNKKSGSASGADLTSPDTYKEMIENINTMVVIWDSNFTDVSPNTAFNNYTGYDNEECNKEEVLKKIFPKEYFLKQYDLGTNGNMESEFALTAKNGETKDIIWSTSVIKRGTNDNLMISIGFDKKELETKRVENKALSDGQKLELSMQLSEIGILLKKSDDDDFYISEQIQKNLGIHKESVSIMEIRNLIHPKDKIIFDTYCMGGKDLAQSEIQNAEMRILCSDGEYHWFNFRYKKTVLEHGKAGILGGAIIDITKEKEKDSLIEKMAYIDETTQIYNRNKFIMIGQEIFEISQDLDISYWLIVLDIDKLHIINDICGYQNGNVLLREFANIITNNISQGGFASRIADDDFAVIYKKCENNDPVKLIRKIQKDLADFASVALPSMPVTCSASYCIIPHDGEDFSQCLDHAVFSIHMNADVRSDIQKYDNKLHDRIIRGNQLENEINRAIDNNEFVLYYQPKIDLSTGNISGMEALIRWIREDGTVVPPSYFIPVAEQSIMITRISRFVLYEACRQNKEWQDMGYPKFPISVNLTSVDFYQTNLIKLIEDTLEETGLEPQYLEIELAERIALKDINHVITQMEEIKNLGVMISMDDFGTGYSSLSYIQMLPITLLKLDRSFIMYLEEDEVSREIVSAVIRIAKSKKISTVAEGIETPEQAEILKESGCDNAQGYFFGKPMPPEKLQEFLEEKMAQKPCIVK